MTRNDLGRNFLTDQCQKIEMKAFLLEAKRAMKESLLKSVIKANGLSIKFCTSKTGNGGERWWFTCPLCEKRCEKLFQHPISEKLGCRKCLNLKYRKSAKKGMVERTLEKNI